MATSCNVSRREFIKNAARVTAGVTAAGASTKTARADVYKSLMPQTVLGANERIRTGHIGTGGMGQLDLGYSILNESIEPAAICDLWPKNLARGVAFAKQRGYTDVTEHHDFREIIEKKDIDAVVIATPDHWHAIPTIMACDAGKDVYCEKPLTTTIKEGQAVIAAVRRNNTVLQCGTMQRSCEVFQEAVELVREGYIGKVAHVETWIHDPSAVEGIGSPPDEDPPEGCDWEFHQGWTERVPFNRNRWLYNFRWFLDYSGGKITDWGAHLVDIAIMAMDEEKEPLSVAAVGGKYILTDNRTTPDTLEVVWKFDDYMMTFTNRVYSSYPLSDLQHHGILFHGTLGSLKVDRSGYEIFPIKANGGCESKKLAAPRPRGRGVFQRNISHFQDFVDCVRSRKDPVSDVDSAYKTATLCHMGSTSYVTGKQLEWNPGEQKFANNPEANDWAYRPYHNGWELG